MTRSMSSSWKDGICLAALCFAMSNGLQAQTAPPSAAPAPAPAAPSANSSQAEAAKAHDDTFVIGNDDVLVINVWKEPDVSRTVPVRSDGKISLPLVGEVQAAGQTPLKLEQDIAAKLKNYVSEPEVTVIVQQINSQKFNILGMVNRPGTLSRSRTRLRCWMRSRSLEDLRTSRSRNPYMFCVRTPTAPRSRLPFNYKEVVKGTESGAEHQAAAA